MSLPKFLLISDLVDSLWQHFNLSQKGFAVRSSVSFNTVNRCAQKHSLPSLLSLTLDAQFSSIGELEETLMEEYFPEGTSDV